jgi:ribosomal protein L37AE/L43A
MPEFCPHCDRPVTAERRESEDGPATEVWRCPDCEEEWRHPDETVLNRELDFSGTSDQLSRRDSDTDLTW